MSVYRRAYLYLTCAISVQALAWAAIGLLRALLSGAPANAEALAFSAALAIVATPLFLVHWRWVRKAIADDELEHDAALRYLYLYGVISLFLIPLLANAYDLVALLIGAALDLDVPRVLAPRLEAPAPADAPAALDMLWRSLAAVVVLGVAIAYHWRLLGADRAVRPITAQGAVIRRVFVLGFSLLGGALVSIASVQLLRWLLIQFEGDGLTTVAATETAVREAARATVGLAAWITFWSGAQRLFERGSTAERRSALRKLYLYGAVFVGVVGVVMPTVMILTGVLRRLMGLPLGGSLAGPLPVIPIAAAMWAYHTWVLRHDTAAEQEAPRQASVRRISLYLVSAVGLTALLAGLAGVVQVLVGAYLGPEFGDSLREQLATSAAMAIVGLPVWLVAWWRAQRSAASPDHAGEAERRSTARRLYLYFFLFVATVTVLAGAIVLVYRMLGMLVGVASDIEVLQQTAAAAGYCVIGVLVWLYHGSTLRQDGRAAQQDMDERLSQMSVAVVDDRDGSLGRAVLDALSSELPALAVDAVALTPEAASAMETETAAGDLRERLAQAAVIVSRPPTIPIVAAGDSAADATPDASPETSADTAADTPASTIADTSAGTSAATATTTSLAAALDAAPGVKLLVPRHGHGWEWMGVEHRSDQENAAQVAHAVRLLAEGRTVEPLRPLGAPAMIGIALAVVVLLSLVVTPIVGFVLGGGMRYLFGP